MTLGNMRSLGVRKLFATCRTCGHHTEVDVDGVRATEEEAQRWERLAPLLPCGRSLEPFSIRLGVSRVCEISFAFFFGNPFEKRGDCSPKLLNGARLHLA